ncbi:MAG: hypothetical protein ABIT71_08025 [Vicinamibacteraceae bacterium]
MSRRSRTLVPAAIAAISLAGLPLLAFAQAPAPAAAATPAPAPAGEHSLDVTVTYAGKGEVSTEHEVSIFLFTDPNITEASTPVAVGTVETNGGHFSFADLPPVVYIAVVYDDTGKYNREGPPPPGTPVSLHGMAAGAPEGVKPGKDAKVAVTFDDSNRM